MKKLVLLFIIIIVCIGISAFLTRDKQVTSPAATKVSPTTVFKQASEKTPDLSLPVTLEVPRLGISASIEYVGMDKKGNMDIPKRDEDVAWFQPGYLPGKNGNAVIAGHYDTKTGAPAIFYTLSRLKKGDMIHVIGKNGQRLTFTVTGQEIYPSDAFPLVRVFGAADSPRLNLITCEGTYNTTEHNYSHRTVVYSKLSPPSSY